jgi:Zn-finger nucleic acid-binding protein
MSLKCPNCSSEMILTDKYNVEIDHCPRCKGVWLDRGELEKIANMQNKYDDDHYTKYHRGKEYDDDYDDYYSRGKHKKRGFLDDIFDFG